ncbi:hypothetical protein CRM22_008674 [Opisthorchis felineus]|uniref:Sjoegren syndrome/scleroderma autoantigen 1 n=1 Tax=Opisthorchis felineus TaxID=147828 RepID=A0A4S2LAT5_OPIFE|nr:hypothetical protein CRM22_008674 [Opisthorchis felineus]TGZ60224.1 hypothetical protein CRM22_008674 [Opisthorchis felineus]
MSIVDDTDFARQSDRSNQISNLMGKYLLKGWRMTDEYCCVCQTILFAPRDGGRYCVACSEVDVSMNGTNPAVETPRTENGPGIRSISSQPCGDNPKRQKSNGTAPSTSLSTADISVVESLQEKRRWCAKHLLDITDIHELQTWVSLIHQMTETINFVQQSESSGN